MRIPQAKIIGALCLASLAFVGPAFAQESLKVRCRDLDLTQAADAAIMAQRLDLAARDVCGRPFHVVGSRIPYRRTGAQLEACRQAAMNNALTQMDAPLVTQAYLQQSGGARPG